MIYTLTHTYIFLFTNEAGANCNPVYVLSTIVTIIITDMHEHVVWEKAIVV